MLVARNVQQGLAVINGQLLSLKELKGDLVTVLWVWRIFYTGWSALTLAVVTVRCIKVRLKERI